MNHRTLFALLFLLATAGCTANVENPTLNQQGKGGDTTACVASCDDTQVTCNGKCNDDGCKVACKATFDDCSGQCQPSADAGAD